MTEKLFKKLIIIFSCLLFLTGFDAIAQTIPVSEISQVPQPKITSVSKGAFWDYTVYLKGESSPNIKILLNIRDKENTFSYSIQAHSDVNGDWYANLNQPLKSGKYYIEAVAQDGNGLQSPPVESGPINILGTFDFLIGIFSVLVIILLSCFLCIWYASKSAEVKRYRRILSSQRDIISSYNILKKDIDEAIDNLKGDKKEDWKIYEVKFLLGRISGNLEKMNKYVVYGISVIGKYDVVSKIDNFFKFKKSKKL
jgi:hypothetical protein